MCLVGRWRERENSWGPTIFSLGPPNYNLSKIERKQERNFCACEKNIWSLVLCYSFFLFFFLFHSTYFLYSLWTSFHLLLFYFYFSQLLLSFLRFYLLLFFLHFLSFSFPFFKKKFIYSLLHPLFASISFFFFFNYNMDASFLLFLN